MTRSRMFDPTREPTTATLGHFESALGTGLAEARVRAGLTIRDWSAEVAVPEGTLHSYEQATRRATVRKIIEICFPLKVDPIALLELAYEEAFSLRGERVAFTPRRLAHSRMAIPANLRAWADRRGHEETGNSPIHLDLDALDNLALLCGVGVADLTQILRRVRR